jgi:hypothetical protein
MTACFVCEVEDGLANLTQVSAPQGTMVYAHPACIDRHNKQVDKNLYGLKVSNAAGYVRDHDINVDDSYAIETFLRREDPKVSTRFIDAVIKAAREQRDREHTDWLFDDIEKNVEPWPTEANKSFVASVAEELTTIMDRLSGKQRGSKWQPNGEIEHEAAHRAAVLLIMQVAQRKYREQEKAGYEEYMLAEAAGEVEAF